MSFSEIGISNIALNYLGEDSIRSFDEKNKRARLCKLFYDTTRDHLLSEFDWAFARKTAELVNVIPEDLIVPDYVKSYQIPSDCIQPRDIFPLGSKIWWDVLGSYILVRDDQDKVFLYYTKRVTDSYSLSVTFTSILAISMAAKLAPSVTQDKAFAKEIADKALVDKQIAWANDANVGSPYRDPDTNPLGNTLLTSGY